MESTSKSEADVNVALTSATPVPAWTINTSIGSPSLCPNTSAVSDDRGAVAHAGPLPTDRPGTWPTIPAVETSASTEGPKTGAKQVGSATTPVDADPEPLDAVPEDADPPPEAEPAPPEAEPAPPEDDPVVDPEAPDDGSGIDCGTGAIPGDTDPDPPLEPDPDPDPAVTLGESSKSRTVTPLALRENRWVQVGSQPNSVDPAAPVALPPLIPEA
jgi:hypothetical protein